MRSADMLLFGQARFGAMTARSAISVNSDIAACTSVKRAHSRVGQISEPLGRGRSRGSSSEQPRLRCADAGKRSIEWRRSMKLEGKRALVTGAQQGIGRAAVLALARE